jgi:hypothetical protein
MKPDPSAATAAEVASASARIIYKGEVYAPTGRVGRTAAGLLSIEYASAKGLRLWASAGAVVEADA